MKQLYHIIFAFNDGFGFPSVIIFSGNNYHHHINNHGVAAESYNSIFT